MKLIRNKYNIILSLNRWEEISEFIFLTLSDDKFDVPKYRDVIVYLFNTCTLPDKVMTYMAFEIKDEDIYEMIVSDSKFGTDLSLYKVGGEINSETISILVNEYDTTDRLLRLLNHPRQSNLDVTVKIANLIGVKLDQESDNKL